MHPAKNTWNCWSPCRCSSSMIWECASYPLPPPRSLLEIVMRRYERASTLLTSNRPVGDWGKLLGDGADATAGLDRFFHHGHALKCGRRSWRTKLDLPPREAAG